MKKHNYNFNILEKESPEKYYFLGFIAADGYVSDSSVIFELNNKDKYMVEKLRDYICPEKSIYDHKRTDSAAFAIFNKKKALELKKYFSMISNQKTEEIKGYRGDKVYIGARLRILGNEIFLKELNEKTKLLYPHNTNAVNRKGKENIYVVTYNFKTARELLKIIYYDGCLCLKRKFDSSRDEDIVSTLVRAK